MATGETMRPVARMCLQCGNEQSDRASVSTSALATPLLPTRPCSTCGRLPNRLTLAAHKALNVHCGNMQEGVDGMCARRVVCFVGHTRGTKGGRCNVQKKHSTKSIGPVVGVVGLQSASGPGPGPLAVGGDRPTPVAHLECEGSPDSGHRPDKSSETQSGSEAGPQTPYAYNEISHRLNL